MYTYSIITVLRFLCKPSFTMLYSSLKYGGIFSPKRATKKYFYGGDSFKKNYGEEYMKGLRIRSCKCKSINCTSFPQ